MYTAVFTAIQVKIRFMDMFMDMFMDSLRHIFQFVVLESYRIPGT